LAEELEVSVRTIYRDVAALQAAGVPLWTESGHGGGVRLLDGWRTQLDGLTGPEAGALFLSAVPGVAAELGLGAVVAAAQTKVLATLPPELRGRAARVRERFLLDAPGWFHAPEPVPCLARLADALWQGRPVEVEYRRGEGTVRRRLDPLGLVLKAGVWYLVAARGTTIGTYRVGRVVAVEEREGEVHRPAGFDLAEWWRASADEFDRSILRALVHVRLRPDGVRRLREVVGPGAAEEALRQAGAPDGEGWVETTLAVESEAVALQQLSALGAAVEVLEPASLRAAFAELGRAMAARHDHPPGAAALAPCNQDVRRDAARS
jgi:predicted DNA-binding transcriptional regulator YafY